MTIRGSSRLLDSIVGNRRQYGLQSIPRAPKRSGQREKLMRIVKRNGEFVRGVEHIVILANGYSPIIMVCDHPVTKEKLVLIDPDPKYEYLIPGF